MPTALAEKPVMETLRDLVMWQDPERLSGAPCFRDTRVPIKNLFDYIEGGDSIADFMDGFPGVTYEQIQGAIFIGKESLIGNYYER